MAFGVCDGGLFECAAAFRDQVVVCHNLGYRVCGGLDPVAEQISVDGAYPTKAVVVGKGLLD
nr:hypothetical protein [Corynebacterium cystitidis]